MRNTAEKIEAQLLSLLGTEWPVGSKLPPTAELASRLGTGQRNTHRAVKALARRGILRSRRRAGTWVVADPAPSQAGADGFDAVAPMCAGVGRAQKHVVLITDLNPSHQRVCDHLRATLADAGVRVEVVLRKNDANDLSPYCSPAVDGLALVFPNLQSPVRFDERRAVVIVAASSRISILAAERFDTVCVDDEQAAILAGRYAKRLGAQRPCVVGVTDLANEDQFSEVSRIRLKGFEDGYGVRVADGQQIKVGRYTIESGVRAGGLIARLTTPADFVFAASDELALGVLEGARVLGLEAGRDFTLLGFDGQERGRALPEGPLSTLDRPELEMARIAAAYLTDRLARPTRPPRRLLLGCTLFEGATTRPAVSSIRTSSSHLATERKGAL